MLTTASLYNLLIEEQKRVLDRFEQVENEHLYFTALGDTWSPEMLFRHLIMSAYWMAEYTPGEKIEPSALALREGKMAKTRATLQEIRKELSSITSTVLKRMESLSSEMEEEKIDAWWGNVPRQIAIAGLIDHDHAHLGQIMWLFKRSTGWKDKEIYNIE